MGVMLCTFLLLLLSPGCGSDSKKKVPTLEQPTAQEVPGGETPSSEPRAEPGPTSSEPGSVPPTSERDVETEISDVEISEQTVAFYSYEGASPRFSTVEFDEPLKESSAYVGDQFIIPAKGRYRVRVVQQAANIQSSKKWYCMMGFSLSSKVPGRSTLKSKSKRDVTASVCKIDFTSDLELESGDVLEFMGTAAFEGPSSDPSPLFSAWFLVTDLN